MFNKTLFETGLTANIDNMLYIPVDRIWENVHGQTKKGGSIWCMSILISNCCTKTFFFFFFNSLFMWHTSEIYIGFHVDPRGFLLQYYLSRFENSEDAIYIIICVTKLDKKIQ